MLGTCVLSLPMLLLIKERFHRLEVEDSLSNECDFPEQVDDPWNLISSYISLLHHTQSQVHNNTLLLFYNLIFVMVFYFYMHIIFCFLFKFYMTILSKMCIDRNFLFNIQLAHHLYWVPAILHFQPIISHVSLSLLLCRRQQFMASCGIFLPNFIPTAALLVSQSIISRRPRPASYLEIVFYRGEHDS